MRSPTGASLKKLLRMTNFEIPNKWWKEKTYILKGELLGSFSYETSSTYGNVTESGAHCALTDLQLPVF